MSSLLDLKVKIADATVLSLRDYALKVAPVIRSRVYIYDSSSYFANATPITIESYRLVTLNNKYAMLSPSLQKLVPDVTTFVQLLPPYRLSQDSIGVYVTP